MIRLTIDLCIQVENSYDAGVCQKIVDENQICFLDGRLKHFVGVGIATTGARPCFDIVPERFTKYLSSCGRQVLEYNSLLRQVGAACLEDNGINMWSLRSDYNVLRSVLNYYDNGDSSTVVVYLDPAGMRLDVLQKSDPLKPIDFHIVK